MPSPLNDWDSAVSVFGASCAAKLAGPGDKEAAIRAPLEVLIEQAGGLVGRPAVLHDEVRDSERRVRPDYGVSVEQVMIGYIEVKAPGISVDPSRMRGHNLLQWERQRDLPNLLYTNGTDWRLYRDGVFVESASLTAAGLAATGGELRATPQLETILRAFLNWNAAPITSVNALVKAIAPLTRLLRGEVIDQLAAEHKAVAAGGNSDDQPFTGLAKDWRNLLFPQADDKTFADGYAQAVTFALLLARTTGISFDGRSLHDVGADLGVEHSLMGRALQLLIDDVAADFKVTLDILVTVVGAVRWDRIRTSRRDVYLYLYEEFLAEYDDDLRQASGTYYTPGELVDSMVRLTQDVLVDYLGIPDGFASDEVFTIDPAMGTGTFLQSIVETVRRHTEEDQGPGAVPGALTQLAGRLAGFEIQMGPFAVAELRVSELFAAAGATLPADGLKLYVTDTLDDPTADETQIASGLQTIAKSRKRANALKRDRKVNVVIGNPPYRELASGKGGWVEQGSKAAAGTSAAILGDFLEDVPGRLSAKLKNLYVYFWRWATFKVWESTPDNETGVVCFVTTSGYVAGSAFTGMRRYLRASASEGWIIDLTPEGQTPDVATRLFPGVRQPLAIGIFVRQPETVNTVPAKMHYLALHGRRADKFAALRELKLDDPAWRDIRPGWTAPFTAAPDSDWDSWPTVDQILPWYTSGVFPTRTWVYSPSTDALSQRWRALVSESDMTSRRELMKDSSDAMDRSFKDLPKYPHEARLAPIASLAANAPMEQTATVAFRAFDRQNIIADPRLIHRAREGLWAAAQVPNQVYVVEQHSVSISDGPGLLFTASPPDFHYFNNRGGRTMPSRHPDGVANLAPGLTCALSALMELDTTDDGVVAYIAAITAHPAFTQTFSVELETPGIRVPMTRSPDLWQRAIELGSEVVWAQTFAVSFADASAGRPADAVQYPVGDGRRIRSFSPVSELPENIIYDADAHEVVVGKGRFGPVSEKVFAFETGRRNVLKSWVAYRSKEPAGLRSSPLDDINPVAWEHAWTKELIEVLTVLTRLVELEQKQCELLEEVLASPLVSSIDLAAAGVTWPIGDVGRGVRSDSAALF